MKEFYSFCFDVDCETLFWMKYKELFGSQGFEIVRNSWWGAAVRIRCRLINKTGRFRSFESSGGLRFIAEQQKFPYSLALIAIKVFE